MRPICAVALFAAAGCAWSNPANRPVWNAFEQNVVPDGDTAFYATLPLTVPAGLGAILVDTLVVHPVRVIDDAAGDAGELWDDLDWQKQYYTELGFLPLHAAATPFAFVGSWFGRICFNIPPRQSRDPAARAAAAQSVAEARRTEWLAFLSAVEQHATASPPARAPVAWDAELAAAFERTHRVANARGRHLLLRTAARHRVAPLVAEPWLGLRDPDPVVRYLELQACSGKDVPADLRRALRADDNEMVRLLAEDKLRE